jgi:hypothetical protein
LYGRTAQTTEAGMSQMEKVWPQFVLIDCYE